MRSIRRRASPVRPGRQDVTTAPLAIDDGRARAVVRPDLGAGLSSYDLADGTPLFRPAPGDTRDPFALANILLVPWSNRIGGSGFAFAGEHFALLRNVPGEALPIHGSGFAQAWRVTQATSTRVDLELECDEPPPFRYTARASYELQDGTLRIVLSVVNAASLALPYGVGLHPWLPRTPRTTLQLPAGGVWLENPQHLPTEHVAIATRPDWDFSAARALPASWINNAFTGWSHRAIVGWPERGVGLEILAGPALDTCIVFSPGGDSDFVCVEPVSHPVDAHNLPGGPEANGLVVLQTDQQLAVACSFRPMSLNRAASTAKG
jgi:aldose 1-epimerase